MKKREKFVTSCGGIKPISAMESDTVYIHEPLMPEHDPDAQESEGEKAGPEKEGGITELVFILDRSGSMAGLESDTVGGFNAMIEKQKKQDGECYVSTVLFDDESTVLHDRIRLCEVPLMTEEDYEVGGCTALIDAIGDAVHHIASIHKYARREDVPRHTVFVITTDGQENASRKYTDKQVKRLIEQKKKCGWEFLFIGANIDAVKTAARYGIQEDRAVNYNADSEGTRVVYKAVSNAMCGLRKNASLSQGWCDEVAADYQQRGKGGKSKGGKSN